MNKWYRLFWIGFLAVVAALTTVLVLRECQPPEPDPLPPTATYTPLPPTVTAKPPTNTPTQPPTATNTPTIVPPATNSPTVAPTEQPTDTATPRPRVTAKVLPTDTPEGPGSLPVTGDEPAPLALWVAIGTLVVLGGVAVRVFGND